MHEIKRSLSGLILLSNQFGRWQSVHHNINKLPRVLFAFLAKIMKNILSYFFASLSSSALALATPHVLPITHSLFVEGQCKYLDKHPDTDTNTDRYSQR